jgi:hypothetical protein
LYTYLKTIKMKKLLAVIMTAGMFGFVACSGSEQPAEDAAAVENAATEAMEATGEATEAVSEAEPMTETADSTAAPAGEAPADGGTTTGGEGTSH